MKKSRLSPLQERILVVLAPLEPAWTLTGGAALAGFYTCHRSTRDVEDPTVVVLAGASVVVDTLHEILVNKLCALLGRSELRDLQDVRAILDTGAELERALVDAPEKDAGFSGPTLAWILRQFPLAAVAAASALAPAEVVELDAFRDALIDRVLRAVHPGEAR